MKQKNLMVFFLTIASVLLLVATVSASQVTNDLEITLDGIDVDSNTVKVVAGETITLKAYFTSDVDASDVKLKAEIEGEKKDVRVTSEPMDLEAGVKQRVVLTMKIPYELKDQVSDDLKLYIRLYNSDHTTDVEYSLRVQRPSYNADIMSISSKQTVEAGETLPVDIALKNIGYNYLDDVYVTVKIPALNLEMSDYFGDLVALECSEDDGEYSCDESDEDTARGRFYLDVPYTAQDGIYTIEVTAKNEDTSITETRQIVINNDFTEGGNVVATVSGKTVAAGENAEYTLLLMNPTKKLKVYRIVVESAGEPSVSVDQPMIAVPAGSSKMVRVTANAGSEGEYNFNVNVFSGDELVKTVPLSTKVEGKSTFSGSPVVVLTVILAIIFLVLLIVLIVLLGKKPEKSEEFGESYY